MPSKERVINARIHYLYTHTKGTFMLTTLKKSVILSSLLLLVPMGLMADLSKQDESKITKLCTDAIGKKGYADYTYRYIEILRAHSENYAMMGQLHKDSKHYEFNCALNTNIKALEIIELVIGSLNPVSDVNTSHSKK
jgi:hypothetical protein